MWQTMRPDVREGGAITLYVSRLELQVTTILSHNIASNGGGILAVTSKIVCNNSLRMSFNVVTDTGGGLYLYQSELSVFKCAVAVFVLLVHLSNLYAYILI